jgi:GNAT superfamily N-acetyltransferase
MRAKLRDRIGLTGNRQTRWHHPEFFFTRFESMTITDLKREGYSISTDPGKLELKFIHDYLYKSYWSEEIPIDIVKKSIQGSLCFGVYQGSRQVGFARMITDRATFAYLADVFIDDGHRGKGLSKWLMETIMSHPDLQGLRRILLATRDAHKLYNQFGFKPLDRPESIMQFHVPGIYKKKKQ